MRTSPTFQKAQPKEMLVHWGPPPPSVEFWELRCRKELTNGDGLKNWMNYTGSYLGFGQKQNAPGRGPGV